MNEKASKRFWAKVKKSEDGCWEWTGSKNEKGYGLFSLRGMTEKAHRVSWELQHGTIPRKGPRVLHRCDNRSCVRPSHLFLGTQAANNADCVAKGRARIVTTRGEDSSAAKVTWSMVLEMRRLAGMGALQRVLADRYGISRQQVGRILRGTRWQQSHGKKACVPSSCEVMRRRTGKALRAWYGISELAALLGVTRWDAARYVERHGVPIDRTCRTHRVLISDLMRHSPGLWESAIVLQSMGRE